MFAPDAISRARASQDAPPARRRARLDDHQHPRRQRPQAIDQPVALLLMKAHRAHRPASRDRLAPVRSPSRVTSDMAPVDVRQTAGRRELFADTARMAGLASSSVTLCSVRPHRRSRPQHSARARADIQRGSRRKIRRAFGQRRQAGVDCRIGGRHPRRDIRKRQTSHPRCAAARRAPHCDSVGKAPLRRLQARRRRRLPAPRPRPVASGEAVPWRGASRGDATATTRNTACLAPWPIWL
jgi:hypothetical protein